MISLFPSLQKVINLFIVCYLDSISCLIHASNNVGNMAIVLNIILDQIIKDGWDAWFGGIKIYLLSWGI